VSEKMGAKVWSESMEQKYGVKNESESMELKMK
jgi:hypothetical protein